MKTISKMSWMLVLVVFVFTFSFGPWGPVKAMAFATPKAAFDVNKMGDMSDFDPNNPAMVPTGDTIKIALVASFSGPAALVGQIYWISVLWAAHDINKRGGILVDGKKKLVQVIKADHMSKPDQGKKICERMVLQEKVHVLWGTDGSNLMKVINETANKYKVISQNTAALSDELNDATNFSRYSFFTSFSCDQIGRGIAYYYAQIRKKEKKFYILCQDYMFGHSMAEGFKKGLKQYYPEGQIVGEDYHKLFLTDFAPYLTKIKASGAGSFTPVTGFRMPPTFSNRRDRWVSSFLSPTFSWMSPISFTRWEWKERKDWSSSASMGLKTRLSKPPNKSSTIKPGTTCGRPNGRLPSTPGFSSTGRETSAPTESRPIGF